MDLDFHKIIRDREEISVRYDPKYEAVWVYQNPSRRPCFSTSMLLEVHEVQLSIIDYFRKNDMKPKTPIKYFLNASQMPQIYNYGGDLDLFSQLIINRDYDALYEYAKLCIDLIYYNAVNLHLPITTISVVEGSALGGGLEAALSCNVCIAEESCQMGVPEIRFNLIPGMGAYSLLARSVGIKKAEEIISSGKTYDAKTFHKMGVIATLAKDGGAQEAANRFMKRHSKFFNGMQAMQAARHRYAPIDYDELLDITKIWVEAALRLTKKDIKMMRKLVEAQNQKNIDKSRKLRAKQDRRFDGSATLFPLVDSSGNVIENDRRMRSDQRNKRKPKHETGKEEEHSCLEFFGDEDARTNNSDQYSPGQKPDEQLGRHDGKDMEEIVEDR